MRQPLVCVQHDWIVDVAARSGSFWVSSRAFGEPSMEGSVSVHTDGEAGEVYLKATPGFEAALLPNSRGFSLRTPHDACVTFHAPSREVALTDRMSVRALRFTSTGSSMCVGGPNGILRLVPLPQGKQSDTAGQPIFDGHTGDITCVRFFPSNEVVLTGSADARVKIWAAATGDNPVTLTAHTRRVSCVHIVGRGRNVLSAAWDGAVHLHDCGTAQSIACVVSQPGTRWTAMDDVGPAMVASPFATPMHEREVATDGVVMVCVADNGDMVVADVRARALALTFPCQPAPLLACVSLPGSLVATGSDVGVVTVHDLRRPGVALVDFGRGASEAAVTALCARGPQHIAASYGDGACLYFDIEAASSTGAGASWDELSGCDLLPLQTLAPVGERGLATAGDDGIVRLYDAS